MIVVEGSYAFPLIDRIQRAFCMGGKLPYGASSYDIHTRMMSVHPYESADRVSLDYSDFDASIPGWVIRLIISELKEVFDYHPCLEKDFEAIANHHSETPLILPDGRVYLARNGLPSGVVMTNIIGSIWNWTLLLYASSCDSRLEFDENKTMVLGDDGTVMPTVPSYDYAERLSAVVREFGMVLNALKCAEGEIFLSRD